jgi:hypothetical protein
MYSVPAKSQSDELNQNLAIPKQLSMKSQVVFHTCTTQFVKAEVKNQRQWQNSVQVFKHENKAY